MAEWEKLLRYFPAYRKYDEFNRVTATHDAKEICEKQGIQDENAKAFCERAVTILKELHNNDNDRNRIDKCVYFQHWFSDQVRKNFSNNDKYFSNYELSNNLFDVINNVNYDEKIYTERRCYASRNAGNVKAEKDLHDYFRNFNSINCKNVSKETCERYYNYVNYINDIYKQRKENNLCCYLVGDFVEPECRHYFDCKDQYNPKYLMDRLKREIKQVEDAENRGTTWSGESSRHFAVQEDNYMSSYDMPVFTNFTPQDFHTLNESLLRTRRLHNGFILAGMVGVFLGLLFYIKSHSAKLWKKKRRAENIDSYMSDVSSNYSSATSETGSEYTPSDSGDSSMYLSYQSSRSTL
ncbi:PIR protein [Plasmodium vivax]|nr:PIR protein [Plasmodium vivax]